MMASFALCSRPFNHGRLGFQQGRLKQILPVILRSRWYAVIYLLLHCSLRLRNLDYTPRFSAQSTRASKSGVDWFQ
jgi:hypothetical protein